MPRSRPPVLAIADTGNKRVLGATASGEVLWELASVAGTQVPCLDQPRWAQLTTEDEVVVCDHCHHRVLRLRWEPQEVHPQHLRPDLRIRAKVD